MDDDILPSEIVAELVDFLSRNCSDRIEDILAAADESGHYGCEVNVEQLVLSSNFVGLKVLNTPDEVLPSLYQALDEVQSNVCEDLDGVRKTQCQWLKSYQSLARPRPKDALSQITYLHDQGAAKA
mmetsp:Transcript_40017/g.159182  ORF Transcript_40017/g.159182 Transcript_40017/m.159182 type:complete len:126 (-) Transcript_40017:2563-2940(-)